eukprot:4011011-Pleurochrysis_carterae.AAC.1
MSPGWNDLQTSRFPYPGFATLLNYPGYLKLNMRYPGFCVFTLKFTLPLPASQDLRELTMCPEI